MYFEIADLDKYMYSNVQVFGLIFQVSEAWTWTNLFCCEIHTCWNAIF